METLRKKPKVEIVNATKRISIIESRKIISPRWKNLSKKNSKSQKTGLI